MRTYTFMPHKQMSIDRRLARRENNTSAILEMQQLIDKYATPEYKAAIEKIKAEFSK